MVFGVGYKRSLKIAVVTAEQSLSSNLVDMTVQLFLGPVWTPNTMHHQRGNIILFKGLGSVKINDTYTIGIKNVGQFSNLDPVWKQREVLTHLWVVFSDYYISTRLRPYIYRNGAFEILEDVEGRGMDTVTRWPPLESSPVLCLWRHGCSCPFVTDRPDWYR